MYRAECLLLPPTRLRLLFATPPMPPFPGFALEDRNVWDARSGRWTRPSSARRGHLMDKYEAESRCSVK